MSSLRHLVLLVTIFRLGTSEVAPGESDHAGPLGFQPRDQGAVKDARSAPAEECLVKISPPTATWCGTGATTPDNITLLDNGDGTATYTASFSNGTVTSGPPTVSLYGKTCGLLFGSLTITMRRQSFAPYVSPNIPGWLTPMGLASLQVISGSLTVYVDHLPFSVPPPQQPQFLNTLQQVAALTIGECLNCAASPGAFPRNVSALTVLPGQTALLKFYNWARDSPAVTALSVTGTAFANMRSLGQLRCAPGSITISNNRELVSLAGLDSLNTTLRPGPQVTVTNNALLSSATVSQLRGLAGCPAAGVVPVLSSSVQIATVECNARCWTSYCSYANGGPCGSCPPLISSPPPPPPVTTASCAPRIPTPACGTLADNIAVRDNGNGQCIADGTIGGTPFSSDCTARLYGQECTILQGSLTLVFRRLTTATSYRPQMPRWLSQLGLRNLTVMARALTVVVDHYPIAITTPLNPVFFQNLLQVGAVVAYECANCGNSTETGPATSVLQSLPGLVSIDRIRDFSPGAAIVGAIVVRNTAFQNMLSFSGLRCTTGQYNFVNNRALTSLSGFEGVGYSFFTPGPFGYVLGNALPSPASVASWRILAGCGSASPIVSNGLLLQVGGCSLQCWVAYCTYLQSGVCSGCPSPPPPPVPPPPPSLPPVTCPLNIAKPAPVCGSTLQRMTLTFGATTCTGTFSGFPALDSTQTYTCAAANPFPGQSCGTFLGDVLITFGQDFPIGASTVAQTYLAQLGIASVSWLGNLLLGRDFYWQNAGIRPTLLPNLRYVSGIFGVTTQVQVLGSFVGGAGLRFSPLDPASGAVSSGTPAGALSGALEPVDNNPSSLEDQDPARSPWIREGPSRRSLPGVSVPLTGFGIEALPGQAALQAVGNLFVLYGTSFRDLSAFPALRCVGTYWISDNPTITSLQGIQPIATAPTGGLVYDGSPPEYLQLTPQSLKLLNPIAKCTGTVSANLEYINMVVINETYYPCPITSWDQICRYTGATLPCFA